MSLTVDLAILAEGATNDARGSLTLVGVNPTVFVAEELPAQFVPVFVVNVIDGNEAKPESLTPGAKVSARIEVQGPDGEVLFVAPLRQVVSPQPSPDVPPRMQVLAQVPFTASKPGPYRFSARIEAHDDSESEPAEVTAVRTVRVTDAASLKRKPG